MVRRAPPIRKPILDPKLRIEASNERRKARRKELMGELKKNTTDLIIIPYTASPLGPPTTTLLAEEIFLNTVLDELQAEVKSAKIANHITWGQYTTQNVQHYLLTAVPIPMSFLTEKKASTMLASGEPIGNPVFVESKGVLPWKSTPSKIQQVLEQFPDSDTVSVNKSSLIFRPDDDDNASFEVVAMKDVKAHFLSSYSSTDPWNVLDLNVPFPETWGTCPAFLQNDNCSLLSHMKDLYLSSGSAARPTTDRLRKEWKEVERWLLLATAGANTMTHQDSFAYDTQITVVEGDFGFAWLYRPSQDELAEWAQSPFDLKTGRWHFTVLRKGTTVFFPSGTVHLVVRIRNRGTQTLGLGGHLLRYSNIVGWVRMLTLQVQHPNATNEDLDLGKVVIYLELVLDLASNAKNQHIKDLIGGTKGLEQFAREVKICCEAMKTKREEESVRMRWPITKRLQKLVLRLNTIISGQKTVPLHLPNSNNDDLLE